MTENKEKNSKQQFQTEVFSKFAKEDTKDYNANLFRFDKMYSQLSILKGKKNLVLLEFDFLFLKEYLLM